MLLQHRFDQRMLNANLPESDRQVVRSQIERQFYDLAAKGRLNQPLEQTGRAVDDVFAATRQDEHLQRALGHERSQSESSALAQVQPQAEPAKAMARA
ncbi:hypothetical protein D9M68_962890 [compost metagenome]